MAEDNMSLAFLEIFFLFLGLSGCVLLRFNEKENGPYMDEVFHIPQVQNYCVGKFEEWDPMITTLPGLYLTTVGLLKPVSDVFSIPISTICSTTWLRCINLMFATGNLYILYLLVKKLHGNKQKSDPGRVLMTSFTLSLFPVLYFFSFLYYTDSGSTFCVLLMYLLSLHGNHKMAACVGALAVMFRQTNIIWVVFVAGLAGADSLMDRLQPEKKDISKETQQSFGFLLTIITQIWNWVTRDWKSLMSSLYDIISCVWSYVLVAIGFVAFVIHNGSIVVGAKEDHQVILHFPQIFYFVSFSVAFSVMHHVSSSKLKSFLRFIYERPLTALVFCVISAILVWKFTYAHKYLLADNRHYTFYVWAKIYRRHDLIKFALIPGYLFAMWNMLTALQAQHILWKCVYCACVVMNLVPSPLLEFRYFIIPYLFYRLHMPLGTYARLSMELALYTVVNVATLYLFMDKPFLWENTSGYQRFMW